MKRFQRLVLANLLLSFSYCAIHSFEKFSFINASFIIGMVYLTFGLFFYVTEQGLFNLTIYSYNKVCKQLSKSRHLLSESNISIDDYIGKKYKFNNTNPLLSSGLILSLSTILLSFVIY